MSTPTDLPKGLAITPELLKTTMLHLLPVLERTIGSGGRVAVAGMTAVNRVAQDGVWIETNDLDILADWPINDRVYGLDLGEAKKLGITFLAEDDTPDHAWEGRRYPASSARLLVKLPDGRHVRVDWMTPESFLTDIPSRMALARAALDQTVQYVEPERPDGGGCWGCVCLTAAAVYALKATSGRVKDIEGVVAWLHSPTTFGARHALLREIVKVYGHPEHLVLFDHLIQTCGALRGRRLVHTMLDDPGLAGATPHGSHTGRVTHTKTVVEEVPRDIQNASERLTCLNVGRVYHAHIPSGDGFTGTDVTVRVLRQWFDQLEGRYRGSVTFVEYVIESIRTDPPRVCSEEMLLRWLNNAPMTDPATPVKSL